MPGATAILLESSTSLISPRAGRGIAEIKEPLFSGEPSLAALFIRQRQVEMHVRMCGHRACCAAQMFDSFVDLAQFFERAAKVVASDSVERIELHCGAKCSACVRDLAGLVVGDAKVDVSFDPIGRQVHHAFVNLNRLGNRFRIRLAIQRHFEELFGSSPHHGTHFRRYFRLLEGKYPLPPNRIEGHRNTRRDDEDFAAMLADAMFLQGAGLSAELLLGERNCEANAASRNFTFGESLYGAERDEIAEAVKAFAPASARANELQPFPITKTARLDSQNAPCFSARVALSQARRSPASEELCRTIMHPLSTRCDPLCCGNVWKSHRIDERINNQMTTSSCAHLTAC
jgi:hypothetical protein